MKKKSVVLRSELFTYWDNENFSKPFAVFFHGLPGSSHDLSREAFKYLRAHFRFITFDRAGYGLNAHISLPNDLSDHARYYREFLVSLSATKSILLSHSWSWALTYHMAQLWPQSVDTLIALAPWAYERKADKDPAKLLKLKHLPMVGSPLFSFLAKTIGRRSLRSSLRQNFLPFETSLKLLDEQLKTFCQKNVFASILSDKSALIRFLPFLDYKAPPTRTPVIIFAGEKDIVTPPSTQAMRLHRELAASDIHFLPQFGHSLPQSTGGWARTITKILRKEHLHVAAG